MVLRLRILRGVYYFKNATENDTAGFDKNPEIWKIACIFRLHSLLKSCPYRHFLTPFGLASGFSESPGKKYSCYGFSVAFTISRMPQKATVPDSTKIQKSEKSHAFVCYILFWNLAHIETFYHILGSRADFLNLLKMLFGLRILCGVYYFKNATEHDSAGF